MHATLNDQQRQAVLHRGDEPLLIIAGAGTGKTTTLAHRIAQLVIDGADPRRILLLTFSRRASQEMVRRAQRVVQHADIPWAGTYHAIGSRLLRMHALARTTMATRYNIRTSVSDFWVSWRYGD